MLNQSQDPNRDVEDCHIDNVPTSMLISTLAALQDFKRRPTDPRFEEYQGLCNKLKQLETASTDS